MNAASELGQEEGGGGGRSRLLVVGTKQCGKKSLVRCMLDYEDMVAGRNVASDTKVEKRQGVPWQVTTKYYTAHLDVMVMDASPVDVEDSSPPLSTVEGVVIVFDATSDDSFEEIKQWVATAEGLGAELRLCVGNKVDMLTTSGSSYEHMYAERINWCLENEFEYIETDATRPTEGHEEREKDGFPRVMESIYSTRWSSLVLRKGSTSTGIREKVQGEESTSEPPAAAAAPPASTAPTSATVSSPSPKTQQATAAAAAVSDVTTASSREKGENNNESSGKKKEEGGKSIFSDAVDDMLSGFGDGGDELDSLFDKIREVRASAGRVGDDERRHRAAEAALRLAAVLGLGAGGDDEEEEG